MGRSVSYLTDAEYVIYFSADWINNEQNEEGEYDQFLSAQNWDDFEMNLKCTIMNKLKSYYESDKWDGMETKIFLENELCEIGISEYCDLYSLSIRAKDDEFYNGYGQIKGGFAKHHAQQVRKTLEKAVENSGGKLLNRLGTFSNGEGVYEYAKK